MQAEAQCLSDVRAAVAPFGVRGTDYLTALEYLAGLTRIMDGGGGGGGAVRGVEAAADGGGSVILVPSSAVDVMRHVLNLPEALGLGGGVARG